MHETFIFPQIILHVSKTMPRAVLAPTLKFTRSSENEHPVAKYLNRKK